MEKKEDEYVKKLFKAISNICEGKKENFNFELKMNYLPFFTRKVLETVIGIPYGFVSTYGCIASSLSRRKAARAVGNIMASNPFPPIVPCHRVVYYDLSLGGYGLGLEIKCLLLRKEGVKFRTKTGSVIYVDPTHLFVP